MLIHAYRRLIYKYTSFQKKVYAIQGLIQQLKRAHVSSFVCITGTCLIQGIKQVPVLCMFFSVRDNAALKLNTNVFFLSLCFSLCVWLSLCVCVSLSLSLSLSLSFSLSLSVFLSLSLSFSLFSLSVWEEDYY